MTHVVIECGQGFSFLTWKYMALHIMLELELHSKPIVIREDARKQLNTKTKILRSEWDNI